MLVIVGCFPVPHQISSTMIKGSIKCFPVPQEVLYSCINIVSCSFQLFADRLDVSNSYFPRLRNQPLAVDVLRRGTHAGHCTAQQPKCHHLENGVDVDESGSGSSYHTAPKWLYDALCVDQSCTSGKSKVEAKSPASSECAF